MKWLKFLKAAKKRALEGGAETGAADDGNSLHKHNKRRSMQHERKERTSIEQWHEARKTRTSIDICTAFNVTTTERLSVCKAGITLLINRTYIVIKHLGSGSSGQVKLAFNLRSKKLVAIKAVRKAGFGTAAAAAGSACGGGHQLGGRDARSYDGRGSASSSQIVAGGGGATGAAQSNASGFVRTSAGGVGGARRVWRSLTPSSILRRSTSSSVGASSVDAPSRGPSPSPSPVRRLPGASSTTTTNATTRTPPAEDLVREIAILKRLSHPNIVQLLEVIDDPASDCLLLVMGYVEGATLQPQQLGPGRWRPLPEQVAWRYCRDVLCGLEYLHCHGVVHGDLKPANFVQDSLTGLVRILDFGSAVLHGRAVGEEGLRGAHGPMSCTPGFRSPESLAAGYRPSFELDMWALGVCLYLWVFGELPFKGSAPFVVYENIRSAPLVIPAQPAISPQLHDLLTRLLDKNPHTRLAVHEAAQHPWTTAQGLAPLRTTSPLVMAARVQLAASAAAATATAAATIAPTSQGPAMGSSAPQPSSLVTGADGGAASACSGQPGCSQPHPPCPDTESGTAVPMDLGPGSGSGSGSGSGCGSGAGVDGVMVSRRWRPWRQQQQQRQQQQGKWYGDQLLPPGVAPPPYSHALHSLCGSSLNLCSVNTRGNVAGAADGTASADVNLSADEGVSGSDQVGAWANAGGGGGGCAATSSLGGPGPLPLCAGDAAPWIASAAPSPVASALQQQQQPPHTQDLAEAQCAAVSASAAAAAVALWHAHVPRCTSHPLAKTAAAPLAPPPPAAAVAAPTAAAASEQSEGPWRMSAVTAARSNTSTSNGIAPAPSGAPNPQPPSFHTTGLSSGTGMSGTGGGSAAFGAAAFGPPLGVFAAMPRIREGSGSGTGSLGGLASAAALALAAGGSTGGPPGAGGSLNGSLGGIACGGGAAGGGAGTGGTKRRNSGSLGEAWELRRSVTEEELHAAISRCCDPTGSAAVLMESIFAEVTFPAKQQIIRAGDPLDRIYLITAGEVDIYHDLAQDGPDAPCPHKPIIEGLSDPESDLDDPGDFLNIRLPGLPGSHVPQLERLSTGLLSITGGAGGSAHGAQHALGALAAANASAGGPAGTSAGPISGSLFAAAASQTVNSVRTMLNALGGGGGGGCPSPGVAGGGGKCPAGLRDNGGREPSGSSLGLFSRAGTQNGHLIVVTKGPGDSLGFAGMLPGGGGFGEVGPGGRRPVWSANVRARTQVTAFAASIQSLHKLARTHPQVEPLLQQMAVQQETDIAVAEAMRSLRLIGGGGGGGGKPQVGSRGAGGAAAAEAGAAAGGGRGGAAAVAASGGNGGRTGHNTGVSSEGESESCGTAGTTGTDGTAASSLACSLQPPQASSVSLWHQRVSATGLAAGAGGGNTAGDMVTGAGAGAGETDGELEGEAAMDMMVG